MSRKKPVFRVVPDFEEVTPIDEREARGAVWLTEGNVTRAAELLGVRPDRLRRFMKETPSVRAEVEEQMEKGVDMSLDVLFEGLRTSNFQVKFQAAKEFLKSEAALKRGLRASSAALELKAPSGGGTLQLKWLDPEPAVPGPKTIEGELVK